jgi:sugar phosphate isomerase/epimerase
MSVKSIVLPVTIALAALTPLLSVYAAKPAGASDPFVKSNLVAWCIVPFDSKHRGPVERAKMLNRLGITKLAYDWREQHIPTFDQEIDALRQYRIKLQAFWLTSGPNPENDKNVGLVLDLLRRRNVKTQIWYLFTPPRDFDSSSQEQKLDTAANAVRYIAEKAGKINCSVGLYNHGGWFGEPENQLAILNRLKMRNVGLVYNFNHAEYQMDSFPEFFPKIQPHLIALNLAGLDKQHHKVVAIGEGDSELDMIRIIHKSSYRGPIGIINENTDPDAEAGLRKNMEGLKKILNILGDEQAAKTY